MGWVEDIGEAVRYIEDNITQELKMEQIAKRACVSSFYFQKGFAMLCGFTVKDYIRQRRLSLAGSELASTDEMPDGYVTRVIPAHTWAVFPCKGPMPERMAEVNRKIFSEWLPNNAEYQIAEGYNIEMYTDVTLYPKGNRDENYYSEIWIPVRKK